MSTPLTGRLSAVVLALAGVVSDLRKDGAYAVRTLVKSPAFAAVGVLSLALSIGASALYFAQVDALVGRTLPGAPDPDRLVVTQAPVSFPDFERFREQRSIAARAAAFIGPVPFSVAFEGAQDGAQRVFGHIVSPEYFATLGVAPVAGRLFQPDLERPGSAPVVVVSERFWRTRLDADPNAVGRPLRVNGRSATIIGIGPKDFLGVYPINPADLFVPVTAGASMAPELGDDALGSDRESFRVVVRLAGGATVAAAEAALDVATADPDQQARGPDDVRSSVSALRPGARLLPASGLAPIPPELRAQMFGANVVLLALVLSLACSNLAGLLLARGIRRSREIAIRLAVGAGRRRLVRQFLTESVALALAGGVAGVFFAYWLVELYPSSSVGLSTSAPAELNTRLDLGVLLFSFVVALLTGVGFGLVPALVSTRADVATSLKAGPSPRARSHRRLGFRNLFVAYQVAASLMLLLVTGYLVVGYQRSAGLDAGYQTAGLYLFALDPIRDGYSADESVAILNALPRRLSELASVRAATLSQRAPLADLLIRPSTRVWVPTGDDAGTVTMFPVAEERVGASYFATLGLPIVRGREFMDGDQGTNLATDASPDRDVPIVVNQSAARELFGGVDPVDRRIHAAGRVYFVIGVVRDAPSGFMQPEPPPTMFLPLTSEATGRASVQGTTVVVRGTPASGTIAGLRAEVQSLYPDLTVFNLRTMRGQLDRFNELAQQASMMGAGLGAFGLMLACIGLAGVTTQAVARRRKEIGIRLALGSSRGRVIRLVLKEAVVLVTVGAVIGFAGGFALSRVLSATNAELARLFAAGAGDPFLLVGAPLLLGGLALAACYLPAHRAGHIDPLSSLREE